MTSDLNDHLSARRASDSTHRPQAHVRDLAALVALPAVWRGRDVDFIAGSLLDALISLLRVDVAYLQLHDANRGMVLEDCRSPLSITAREVRDHLIGADDRPGTSKQSMPGRGELRVMRVEPRIERGRALLIVGSGRTDFPTEAESFLLRAAIEHGAIAMEGSRLLHDLREANQAKSTFLATMSHELRTPLNAILGYVDLLEMEVAGTLNERQKQNLARVRSGSLHLQELIEGILSFARIDAGKVRVHRAPVDLRDVVRDTAALIEPLARQADLELIVQLPDAALVVETDAPKVRQILLNLLSNAVKFTPAGTVTIGAVRGAGVIALSVRDTGIGLTPDEQEVIFEPFRQIGEVYTQKTAGTGLGLSVSRQLARLLGGELNVESTPARGSVFTVVLPDQENTAGPA